MKIRVSGKIAPWCSKLSRTAASPQRVTLRHVSPAQVIAQLKVIVEPRMRALALATAFVAILLDNPHMTEPDVLRIAAMRPAVPESLATIAHHARWSLRHAVKRALVLNPSTPLADAMRIATTLRAAELAELAADPSLP